MSGDDVARLTAAIAEYDGKRSDGLELVAAQVDPSRAVLKTLCELVQAKDARVQSASSWLLRRYVDAGAALSPQQTEQTLAVLKSGCQHGLQWQARLHVLQMMGNLTLPSTLAEELWHALVEGTKDVNKFIRAWSYYGLAVLAEQHPIYRVRALSLIVVAEHEDAPSVRARIRRIRKAFKWAG